MKYIVTHTSPDLDAITSVWVIKRFLNGWENAGVKYVQAGDRINLEWAKISPEDYLEPIEKIEKDEVIHVDTGLGALDHHQTQSDKVCGASLSWDFVKNQTDNKIKPETTFAVDRMIKVIIGNDHFKNVYWPDPTADYHEFDLEGILEGLKYQNPRQNDLYTEFIMKCLDAILHNFENRIWAENEIKDKGQEINNKFGKVLAIETMNDSTIKLAQIMGFDLVIKKDPRLGNVRIKASPKAKIDLTAFYEELKKADPKASWFLHVSKKMLLNGSGKNTKAVPSKLSLSDIIQMLKSL